MIWVKEALPNEWKESIIVPIYKKGDKTDCNNYRGISLLSTSYKIQTNILVSRLTPYIDDIIGDHQCGFRRNRSTIDQIFSIRQILEMKWEYNGTVHQLYVDFKKAYDSVKRKKLYSPIDKENAMAETLGRQFKSRNNDTTYETFQNRTRRQVKQYLNYITRRIKQHITDYKTQ